MTDTTTLAPTDEEIWREWELILATSNPTAGTAAIKLARTAIAKWGAPAPASDALRTAAQAIVARWDTPHWKDAEHTGAFIQRLREALAAPPAQEARVPLTDSLAAEVVYSMGWELDDDEKDDMVRVVRATEGAHGITAAQKPQAPALIAAAEAIYALRNLDSNDLPCIEAWPNEFAALGRAITAHKEKP